MRFLNALKNDFRFQIKYGFYFLYAFFTVVYIAALLITPSEYKTLAASFIILTDPAMLGIFFIGGIWLLEKGEGLYILAKAISLAVLSTISADLIVLIGMGGAVHLVRLSFSVFLGAVVFNLIGLMIASYARSVNHYMLIVCLPTAFLSMPPVLTAFGITHPLLELFPGTALWHMIAGTIDVTRSVNSLAAIVLILWLGLLSYFANKRIGTALQSEGGQGA